MWFCLFSVQRTNSPVKKEGHQRVPRDKLEQVGSLEKHTERVTAMEVKSFWKGIVLEAVATTYVRRK